MAAQRTPRGEPRSTEPPLAVLNREIGRVLEGVARLWPGRPSPRVVVTARPAGLGVTVDLGQAAPERIGVSISGRILRVEGLPGGAGLRPGRQVVRTVSLPFEPHPEAVSGRFRDGRLDLEIPRPSTIARKRRNKIHPSDVIEGA